jgi:hypothetical protein
MLPEAGCFSAKMTFVAVVAFVVAAVLAFEEADYELNGREAVGEMTELYKVSTDRGRRYLRVVYRFVDHTGKERTGTSDVGDAWPVPADRRVTVQYVSGGSRIARKPNRAGPVLMAISGGYLLAVGAWVAFARVMNPPPRRRRRRNDIREW